MKKEKITKNKKKGKEEQKRRKEKENNFIDGNISLLKTSRFGL